MLAQKLQLRNTTNLTWKGRRVLKHILHSVTSHHLIAFSYFLKFAFISIFFFLADSFLTMTAAVTGQENVSYHLKVFSGLYLPTYHNNTLAN